MGNSCRVFVAVILIISLFTVSVFATPTGSYDLYSTNGRNVNSYSASGNAYISNFSQHLAYIRVYLDQILSYNANISSTLDYYLPALLTRMIDNFSPGAGDTRTMWQLSAAAVSGITAIQSAALGIAQDVYNINTTTADIDRLAGLIHSDVDQVESQLSTVNTNLQFLESINWVGNNTFNFTYSLDNVNYDSFDNFTNSKDFYLRIHKTNTDRYNYNLYRIRIPLYANSYNINLDLINVDSNYDFNYYVDYYNYYFYIFIYPLRVNTFIQSDVIFHIYSDSLIYSYAGSTFDVSCLNNNSLDFYIVDQYIQSHQSDDSTNLEDIKNILIDIDNNSDFIQNNNDLQINVDIDSSVGHGVTGVISKIQDLLDFGISLQEFLVVLNQFDNLQWFTRLETYEQVNQDPRLSPGYIDLYD